MPARLVMVTCHDTQWPVACCYTLFALDPTTNPPTPMARKQEAAHLSRAHLCQDLLRGAGHSPPREDAPEQHRANPRALCFISAVGRKTKHGASQTKLLAFCSSLARSPGHVWLVFIIGGLCFKSLHEGRLAACSLQFFQASEGTSGS